MNDPVIISDVFFSYGAGPEILKRVSLSVKRGELLFILGSNGCGKSTLLQNVCGLLKPSKGEVLINGKPVSEYSVRELAKNVAVVFQDETTPFPFSVLDVVKMGRTPYRSALSVETEEDKQIALDALEKVNGTYLKDKVFTDMSGGERQIVLIARALAQQSDVILMDEPTSHLDFKNQSLVVDVAYRLAKDEGKTVIMTTHSPFQLFLRPASVALMEHGMLVDYGRVEDVVTEKALSRVYGMRISLKKAKDERYGIDCIACTPVLDWKEIDKEDNYG